MGHRKSEALTRHLLLGLLNQAFAYVNRTKV